MADPKTPQPGDPDFDWSQYGAYKSANPDPVEGAKSFLAKTDPTDPSGRSNEDTARLYNLEHPSMTKTGVLPPVTAASITPEGAKSRGILGDVASSPMMIGSAALMAANVVAPEITLPAELAIGAGTGMASAMYGGSNPLAGAAEGAMSPLLEAAGPVIAGGGRLLSKGAEVASKMPWYGRAMLAKFLGAGEAGEAAALAGPAVAKGVGKGVTAAGEYLGERSLVGRSADALKKFFGLAGEEAPVVERYAPNVGRVSREIPGSSYPTPTAPEAPLPTSSMADIDQYAPSRSGYVRGDVGETALPSGGPVVERYAPNVSGLASSPAVDALTPEEIGRAQVGHFRTGSNMPGVMNPSEMGVPEGHYPTHYPGMVNELPEGFTSEGATTGRPGEFPTGPAAKGFSAGEPLHSFGPPSVQAISPQGNPAFEQSEKMTHDLMENMTEAGQAKAKKTFDKNFQSQLRASLKKRKAG